jgi:8-oxo-dGTP pyrophosphatase MutT (NUDIX family)
MAPHSSAAKEAFEEAGVIGRVDPDPIAIYVKEQDISHKTATYVLAVTTEAPVWPEKHERRRRWVSVSEALDLADSKSVQQALRLFSDSYVAG